MNRKIKIAFFVNRMVYGGVEAVIFNYTTHMNNQKFEFHIITQDINDEECMKDFEDKGFIIHVVPHKKKSLLRNIFQIFKILKIGKFDIVHSHMTLTNFYVLFIAMLLNIKIRLSHSHNYFYTDNILKKMVYYLLRKINLIVATDYLSCGVDAAHFLFGKKNVKKGKVFILNNAIEIEKYSFNKGLREKIRKQYTLEDTFCIGHVGRFMSQKNHEFLIDIFNEIHKKIPQSRLLLVGDGDDIDKIKNKVKKLKIEKYVFFTGNINNVREMYQAMDVLVLPSLYEGLPVVLIEAQAAGLSCIVSDNVDRRSALSEQMEFISLNDRQKWVRSITEKMGCHHVDNSKIIAEKGYSIAFEAPKLEKYYLSK